MVSGMGDAAWDEVMAAIVAGYQAERADRARVLRAAGHTEAHVAAVLAEYDSHHWFAAPVQPAPVVQAPKRRPGVVAFLARVTHPVRSVPAMVTAAMTL